MKSDLNGVKLDLLKIASVLNQLTSPKGKSILPFHPTSEPTPSSRTKKQRKRDKTPDRRSLLVQANEVPLYMDISPQLPNEFDLSTSRLSNGGSVMGLTGLANVAAGGR